MAAESGVPPRLLCWATQMHSAKIHCPGQKIALQKKGRNRNNNVMRGQRSKKLLLLSNAKESNHPKFISDNSLFEQKQ